MRSIKIGFVPSHRSMFRDDFSLDMKIRIFKVLAELDGLKIVVPDENITQKGLIRDDSEAEKTIDLFKKEKVEGLVISAMNFGDEISAVSVASAFPECPKFIFAVKEEPDVTGDARRDSFCGTLSIASGLFRRNIPFIFAGVHLPEEQKFKELMIDFIRVCYIVRGFQGARIGLVGPRPDRFETCTFNEVALLKQFKQKIVTVSLADMFFMAEKIPDTDTELQETIKGNTEQHDLSRLGKGVLQKITRLECVLRRFARENKLAGMGIRCWPTMNQVYGIIPCSTMGRLTDQGIMTSCEADIYGTLSMLLQYLATMESSVPHFIDWTVQHPEKENVFLAWHCGNAPPSLVCKGCPVQVTGIGQGEFSLKRNPVTICRLQEYDSKFKLLITDGNIIDDKPVPQTGSWVKVKNLELLYKTLGEEGFVHHASMIYGDCTRALVNACKFLSIECIIV